MRSLEEIETKEFFAKAVEVAKKANCARSKCGSVIVKDGTIIGEGYNSPPGDIDAQCRCNNKKSQYDVKVTDKTCCVHAEQRAIFDALKKNPEKITGSILYFIRLDSQENMSRAGKPYCTICSKSALDVGIAEFVLWQEDGIHAFTCEEYNDLSFNFQNL